MSAKPEESIDETDSTPQVEGDKDGKEGDVREHMVGILFSKGNLSGLQKQVGGWVCMWRPGPGIDTTSEREKI